LYPDDDGKPELEPEADNTTKNADEDDDDEGSEELYLIDFNRMYYFKTLDEAKEFVNDYRFENGLDYNFGYLVWRHHACPRCLRRRIEHQE
jgi:hypothetical protein